MGLRWAVLVLVVLVACSTAAAESGTDAGAPLGGSWMEKLDLDGGGVAYVAPPLGSTEPRPVVVAVHGAFDHPGLMCSAWRVIVDTYAFVVCPAGSKGGKDTYVWPSSDAIDKATDAALAAVRAKYGARVKAGPAVYAAFSQGANMAAPVLGAANKGRFARAALTEGGYRAFEDGGLARAFVKAGGKRVLYTCSQGGCTGSFAGSKAALVQAGAEVRVESPGAFGHSMVPEVRASLNRSLPWLVDGLSGWEGYAAAPKLASH
ncbi:MAG: hypothetical protein KIT84_41165 [Labilithrix sp.]|nr:hypothetical protein [Labilithrix sp.]MCW5817482.1 hypothetical protein [Labilithrix sp.]